jgi:hypothetical protein
MGKIKELYSEAEELLQSNDPVKCAEGTGMINILDRLSKESYANKMDFTELRNQKRTLLNVIDESDEETANDLTGILHLIDALQDFAVDELGWDENLVYDFEDEDGRDD